MTDLPQQDPYQAILRKVWDSFIPYKVLWELTYRCNERCLHCYVTNRDGRGELTTVEARRVVDELAEAGCLFLSFTGGEALLREDFFDIAGYARQRGFAVRLLTNGTLITPAVADRLRDLHPLMVEVSFYGALPETHDAVTQVPGSYERTLRALRLLRERGVRVYAKSVLMERTVDEFQEMQALAEELSDLFLHAMSLLPADDGSDGPLDQAVRQETLQQFYSRYLEEWGSVEPSPEAKLCNAAINTVTIDPYGNVRPCVQLRMVAGSLREQRFGEIWRESPVLQQVRNLTFSQLRECPACELLPYCVRCSGMTYLETGDMLACSPTARKEALVRRAVLEAKGIVPSPDGQRPPCEQG